MRKAIFFLSVLLILGMPCQSTAKKIKNSYKITKQREDKGAHKISAINGTEICLADSIEGHGSSLDRTIDELRKCTFAGYDKEAGSSMESFHLVNGSDKLITGLKMKIDYFDMHNRMLHSRTVTEPCFVPPGESRRIDIKSWDLQHTYYYHLGNTPKKVATPFKVTFHPLAFWIEE